MPDALGHILEFSGLFALSFFVSLYATLTGGASIVLIPVMNMLGYPLVVSIASTRVTSVFLEGISVIAFLKKKAILWRPALWTALFAMPSAILGAQFAHTISPVQLAYSVAILLLLLLLLLIHLRQDSLKGTGTSHPSFYPLMAALALLLGLYGGYYGASFSTLVMLAFVFIGGQNLFLASGNASVVTVFMSLSAAITYFFAGEVRWNLVVPLTLGGVAGTWLSVNLAYQKGFEWIRRLLIVVIIASVIKLLVAP